MAFSLFLPDVFFSLCLALMVASLLETIFITNLLSGSSNFSPAPHWIRVFVLQFLGYVVCLPFKPKQTKRPGTDSKQFFISEKCILWTDF